MALEVMSLRRSFFMMQPNPKNYLTQWCIDLWGNKFLFGAVLAGFITIFPVLYIPVINDIVFKHTGISWEWGIVFVESVLFFLGIEGWKMGKRAFFRRQDRKQGVRDVQDVEQRMFGRYLTDSSLGGEEKEKETV